MNKIKESAIGGTFYSSNCEILHNEIKNLIKNSKNYYLEKTNCIVTPHAGLMYSGLVQASSFKCFDIENIKNIFIIAPSHHKYFDGIAVSSFTAFKTPLGLVNVNLELQNLIVTKFDAKIQDSAFEMEHSIEIQLPFIQTIFENDIKIIPILIGNTDYTVISEILEFFIGDKTTGFIITSDLSHYHNKKDANEIDIETLNIVEKKDLEKLTPKMACGLNGLMGLINFAKKHNYNLIPTDYKTSYDANGDNNHVVGYAGWMLTKETKENFIKNNLSQYILNMVDESIKNNFKLIKMPFKFDPKYIPQVLLQKGASFVTLTYEGNLKGCIGSILPFRPLYLDIIENANSAAFEDPRFMPITSSEFENSSVEVSILTPIKKLDFKSKEDLLEKITPYSDGVIIKDKGYQGVYLPQVWEILNNKEDFFSSLLEKAGLSEDYFSNSMEVFIFQVEIIKK